MLFKTILQKEIYKWVDMNYITQNQAQNILDHYTKKRSFSIIAILGYFFLGLSLLVFIGHNWENIPIFLRASALISLTLFVQFFAFFQFYKHNKSNLFFLGNFIYGASIMLIAQAYHLGTYSASGVFWWALGSFFIALLVQNRWVSLQAFLLALLWYLLEIDSFYPAFFWLFLAFCAIILYKDETNRPLFVLFATSFSLFYLYSLSKFLYHNTFTFANYTNKINSFYMDNITFTLFLIPTFAYCTLLFSEWLSQKWHSKWKDYGLILKTLSFLALYFATFFLLFRFNFSAIIKLVSNYDKFEFFWILGILFAPIFLLSFVIKKRLFFSLTALHVIFIILLFFINDTSELICFVFINIAIFSFYASLIYQGVIYHTFINYFLGVFGMLVFAFIRYIALVNDYISASLLFLVCAVILLLASKFYTKLQKSST